MPALTTRVVLSAVVLLVCSATPGVHAALPEIVVPAVAPFDMSVSGGLIYWEEEVPGMPLIARISASDTAGGLIPRRLQNSQLYRAGILARGNTLFCLQNDYSLKRFWPSSTGQNYVSYGRLARTASHSTDGVRRLAYSAGRVYWADFNGIHRVSLGAGFTDAGPLDESAAQEHVAILSGLIEAPAWLVVDASHAYWWQLDSKGWGIYRAPVAGGTPELLYRAAGSGACLAVDPDNIYWGETGARIGVGSNSGPIATPTFYSDPIPDAIVTGLVVDGQHVYWTQRREVSSTHVNLRRCQKNVLPPFPEDLAYGTRAAHLEQDSFYVYWTDSEGIKRLKKDTDGIGGEFSVTGMEITQCIQNLANDVPLYADKETVVRVYARNSAPTFSALPVRILLRGRAGGPAGQELPQSPLAPMQGALINLTEPRRDDFSSTVNFWLPPSWRSNTVHLTAEINPAPGMIPETVRTDNTLQRGISFQRKEGLCLLLRPVLDMEGGMYRVSVPTWPVIRARFAASVPTADIRVREMTSWLGPLDVAGQAVGAITDINASLLFSDAGEAGRGARRFHVALINAGTPTGNLEGYALPRQACWVKMLMGGGNAFERPSAGMTLTHEIAHTMGWMHLPASCGAAGPYDLFYPYFANLVDDGRRPGGHSTDLHYGFDPISQTIINPITSFDFMGYCRPWWTSDVHWKDLADCFADRSGLALAAVQANAPHPAADETSDMFFVSGIFPVNAGDPFTFGPTYRLPAGFLNQPKIAELLNAQRDFTATNASHAVEFLDAGGKRLAAQVFEPLPGGSDGPQPQPKSFFLTLPASLDAKRLRVTDGTNDLGSMIASANAPTVVMLSPAGGESFSNSLTISWIAQDLDGDALKYMLQYSRDGGTSWEVLAQNYGGTSFTQAVEHLPGGTNCMVRVLACESLNAAFAVSAPFAVRPHRPQASIVRPQPFQVFKAGEQIILDGFGYDVEDGSLSGSAFAWTLEGIGPLGSGNPNAISDLGPGTYRLTLTVTDVDGEQGSASTTLVVANEGEPKCAQFSTDFKLLPATAQVLGAATLTNPSGGEGGELLALTAGSNQVGSLLVEDLVGLPASSFLVSFKVALGGINSSGAEGFSFCFGNDLPDAPVGEQGAGSGLIVSFNARDSGGEDAPAIDVFVHGTRIAHKPGLIETGSTFTQVEIRMRQDHTLDVRYGTNLVFDHLPTGFAPAPGARFAIGARTSTSADIHWVDDLTIAVCNDDIISPVIHCPTNLFVWTCEDQASVAYSASVTDDRDTNVVLSFSPPSGSLFLPGTHSVFCTAKDTAGNSSRCDFTVTVVHDTNGPVIYHPSNMVVLTSTNYALVHYDVSATDNQGTNVALTCVPASDTWFAEGLHTVQCTATDACGNITLAQFTVQVLPTETRPVLAIHSQGTNVVVTWPGQFADFRLESTRTPADPNSWRPWPEPVVRVADLNLVSIIPEPLAEFFRLVRVGSGQSIHGHPTEP